MRQVRDDTKCCFSLVDALSGLCVLYLLGAYSLLFIMISNKHHSAFSAHQEMALPLGFTYSVGKVLEMALL